MGSYGSDVSLQKFKQDTSGPEGSNYTEVDIYMLHFFANKMSMQNIMHQL